MRACVCVCLCVCVCVRVRTEKQTGEADISDLQFYISSEDDNCPRCTLRMISNTQTSWRAGSLFYAKKYFYTFKFWFLCYIFILLMSHSHRYSSTCVWKGHVSVTEAITQWRNFRQVNASGNQSRILRSQVTSYRALWHKLSYIRNQWTYSNWTKLTETYFHSVSSLASRNHPHTHSPTHLIFWFTFILLNTLVLLQRHPSQLNFHISTTEPYIPTISNNKTYITANRTLQSIY